MRRDASDATTPGSLPATQIHHQMNQSVAPMPTHLPQVETSGIFRIGRQKLTIALPQVRVPRQMNIPRFQNTRRAALRKT